MAPVLIQNVRGRLAAIVALAVLGACSLAATADASVVSGTVSDPEDVRVQYPFGPPEGPAQWYTDVRSVAASYDSRVGQLTVTFALHRPIRWYFEGRLHAKLVREKHGRQKQRKSFELVAKYHADAPVPPELALTGRNFTVPLVDSLDFPGGVLTFTAQDRRLRHLNLNTVTDIYTDDHAHVDEVAPIALR